MTSVSAVASADIRSNFSTQQTNAGDDPFSLLLDAVTDVKASTAPDAPQTAERRDDVPAQQSKPETDKRETKRRASESDQPDKPKPEATASKEVAADDADDTEEPDSDDGGKDTLVDALLTLALGETQQQTAVNVQLTVEADVAVPLPVVAAAMQAAATVAIETAAVPALAAAANVADVVETQSAQLATAVKANASIETGKTPVVAADVEAEIAGPNILADSFANLLKPLKALPGAVEGSVHSQPVTIEASASIPARALANLEMLNAALSKHFQLSAAIETDAPASEGQKPIFPGNAVLPNLALSMQPTTTVNAQTFTSADAARAVPLESLAVEIATRARNGERRFDIRLDPPELGRIDVRLEIDHKGNTSTKLIVERAETLDMLQRDARGLEKALQSAGLKTDAGGLEFTLRQDARAQHQPNGPDARHRPELAQVSEEVSAQVALGNASLAAQVRGGVDIRI